MPGSSRLRETIVRSPPVALHSERDAPYEVDIFGSRIPDQIGEKSQLHTFGSFDLPVFTGVQENVLNIEIAVYAVSPDGIPRNHAHAGLHIDPFYAERIGHLEIGTVSPLALGINVGRAEKNRVPGEREGAFSDTTQLAPSSTRWGDRPSNVK